MILMRNQMVVERIETLVKKIKQDIIMFMIIIKILQKRIRV